MKALKYSKKADAVANLYRCALYMVQGNVATALQFLKKSPVPEFDHLSKQNLNTPRKQKYWAEKVLDRYIQLKNTLSL